MYQFRSRLRGHYFAIATFGLVEVARLVISLSPSFLPDTARGNPLARDAPRAP
jgi:ABC-type branched-subunit amino acid transport system permease subunit